MSIAVQDQIDRPAGVRVVTQRSELDRFRAPDCAAVLWHRTLSSEHETWLAGLAPEALPRGRIVLPKSVVGAAVEQLCDAAGLAADHNRDWLVEDIAHLAHVFADLMGTDYLKLRLDVVETNGCRKFHRDAITGRLVCTFRGTGTQYGSSTDRQDPEKIFTCPTGAPVLLRGSLWPSSVSPGLLHRSPPIEGTGETRLVLVLDPASAPEDAL